MGRLGWRARTLFVGVWLSVLMAIDMVSPVGAQTKPTAQEQALPPVRVESPTQKRKATAKPTREKPRVRTVRRPMAPVRPPAPPSPLPPEPTTEVATKTLEPVINTLASTSVVRQQQITQAQPGRLSDFFTGMPSVWFQERGDDPASAINIRGLQDFGRVAVFVDGARQDFQRSGHFANGQFYIDPELLSGVDIVRGPVANIYGSGAIGGVAYFRTKELGDILLPGEWAAATGHGMISSNGPQWLGSTFFGGRGPLGEVFAGGVYRDNGNYREGNMDVVPNTASQIESGLVKLTTRPGDGQQFRLTGITYNTEYNFGQTTGSEGVAATNVKNQTGVAQYVFSRPDMPLVDFGTNVYWNQTAVRQTVLIPFVVPCGPGCNIEFTGPPGTTSSFVLNTYGFDVHNSSRFETGPLRHTLTYGGDLVDDVVGVNNGADPGAVLTPGGRRAAYGGFVEWRMKFATWFEMINAARYDAFNLNGEGISHSGNRLSPRTTVGITPLPGFTPYFTYAEGYRAPSVTETFVAGYHPGNIFFTMPNPNLQPEVGKNKEVGINFKYDGVFAAHDRVRAKVNFFRNEISNYIDLEQTFGPGSPGTPPPGCQASAFGFFDCFQYVNIPQARIEGVEFETNYDSGLWFAGLSGQHLKGQNLTQGVPLATIPPDQISFLLGTRLVDYKLTLAMRWTAVAAKTANQIPTTETENGPVPFFNPTPAYNLINVYVGYQPTPDVLAAFSIENLLNLDYTKYMCCSTAAGYIVPSPGITFKGSLTIRYGIKDNS